MSFALALMLGAAGEAATTTINTTMTVNATLTLTTLTASGTASFTGGIPSGTFSATVSTSSIGTSSNVTVPFTITFSAGNTLTGTVTLPLTLLLEGGSGSGSAAATGGTGTYAGATGSFTLTGSSTSSGTSIVIQFSGPGTIVTGGPATPAITAVLDAASNTANLAEGTIFIVKGSNLCPSEPNGLVEYNIPRPTVGSDGVKITFTPTSGGTGTDALLWYEYNPSGTCQLAAILPSTVATGNYNVTVTNGTVSAPFATQVLKSKFSLFTQDSSGTGLASVQNYISASQVDLNSFTSGNGKGTTISPAHPGQFLLAYGTGMGPAPGDDNILSPVYDFTANGYTVQAVVGGMTVPVSFAGRAGYAGEDQVNVALPANVPTGCAVSFQISVNGTLSNATFISIAPNTTATACVQAGFTTAQLQNLDDGGTYNVGGFSLEDISENIAGFGSTTIAEAGGEFTRFTGYQLASASTATVTSSTVGACTIYTVSGTASATVTSGGGTLLDAGAITLTGPAGSSLTNVALTDSSDAYSLTIGSIAGIPGGVNGTIVAGTYTLNGAGGKDVGKFTASVTIGSPLTVTGGLPTTVARSAGMTLNWTGGNATDIVEIIGVSSASATSSSSTEFVCTTTAGQRTFTVPSSVLTQLPASAANAGFLEVVSTPSPTSGNGEFTAPLTSGGSIDLGTFFALTGIAGELTWQ
jgi:uncharacterized protein (TIGR03437 family)